MDPKGKVALITGGGAVFLVRSDFITGESMVVDGGERFGHCRDRFAEPAGGV